MYGVIPKSGGVTGQFNSKHDTGEIETDGEQCGRVFGKEMKWKIEQWNETQSRHWALMQVENGQFCLYERGGDRE